MERNETLAPTDARTPRRTAHIDPRYSAIVDDVSALSASPRKLSLYGVDTYFREGWLDCRDTFGAGAARAVVPLAAIVFKPDAVAGRRIERALAWLRTHGFAPVACAPFVYDRLMIREAWRYQFNIASVARMRIVDRLLVACPSLYVLLRDMRFASVPASERISSLKGPSVPNLRKPHHLRFHLDAKCTLLNFVHTADEAADVVRELAIYFDVPERRRVLRGALEGDDATDAVRAAMRDLYATTPENALSLDASLDVVQGAARAAASAGRLAPNGLARITGAIADIASGRSRDWQGLVEDLDRTCVEVPLWDKLVIGTELTECNVPGLEPVLEG